MGSLSGMDYFYPFFLHAGNEYLAFARVPAKFIRGNVEGSGNICSFSIRESSMRYVHEYVGARATRELSGCVYTFISEKQIKTLSCYYVVQ